jgi:hypothetical protein
MRTLSISTDTLHTAGILLLTLVAVEYGGITVLRMVTGDVPRTTFQTTFARAGHAHAGVLVILSLIALVLADQAGMTGFQEFVARNAIWFAAILFPAGFFLSSAGPGRTEPNGLILLVYLGALSLTAGVTALGIGLLQV